MTTTEARVLIDALHCAAADLRDLAHDGPLHVALEAQRHIQTVTEAAEELAKIYGVGK